MLDCHFIGIFKRLLNPNVCNPKWGPRYNTECNMCSNQTVKGHGITVFSKVRIDIRRLKIIGNYLVFTGVDNQSNLSICIKISMINLRH
jgi:hypothetical protein